jgi:ectoine hydroxylase-related dioxygenase (phytanoyl-CoA dioxygenase family)
VRHPLILGIADGVLGPWCDRFNLNLTQAIEIHPGASAQFPHRDEDMWEGTKGETQYLLNVMWPLNDFTVENGATKIWPSHATTGRDAPNYSEPIVAEMEPGAALVFLGSTLHGAGANRTALARRGVIISYCLGWLKPFENQWLCYPPHIARRFHPELAELVGYSLHRPNLGNYEGQSPSILLGDNPPAYPAAMDALRPDQAVALDAFMQAMAALEARADGTGAADP